MSRLKEVRRPASHYVTEKMMGSAEGIEPTLPCEKRILNRSRQSQDDLLLLRVPDDDDHGFRRNVINRSSGIVIAVSGAS